jgi:predicted DNA-binding protein (UPF0251 family)
MVSHEPTDAEVEALIEQNPNGCTFETIGTAMGVTKVRAQQIVNEAIAKVLRRLNGRGIRHLNDIAPRSHYSHRTTDSLYG